MKRHISFLRYFILSVLFFSGCTLYMDDPEGLRVLRTEEGYLEPAQTELPDGLGNLKYKYNQKTIAIEDEVEQWVVKVESDTIVWFSHETPDYYLPEEGEMMTCSFREKFPDAFCHRCIERTEEDGMYRCVFTPCSIAEAFDEFEFMAYSVESDRSWLPVAEGEDLTDEQFDSLMYYDSDTAYTASVPRRAGSEDIRTRADAGKDEVKTATLVKRTVKFTGGKLEVSTGSSGLSGSATYGGSITIKGSTVITSNEKTGKCSLDLILEGSLDFWVELEASAGVTLKVPDDICIEGFKLDLGKVGIKGGCFVGPYFEVKHKINGRLDISWKFNNKFSIAQADASKAPVPKLPIEMGSGCSSPTATFKGTGTPTLHVEAGIDIYMALGAKVMGTGAERKGGVRFYTELNQDIDTKKYETAEAFNQKNANFPLMAKVYLFDKTSKGYVDREKELINIDPMKVSDKLVIPFMPVIDKDMKKTYFYCDNYKSGRYKVKYQLKTIGLIGALLDYLPYMRIYDTTGEMLKEVRLELKENLSAGEKTWIDETGIIKKNTKYIIQIGFKSHGLYWLPLHEIPFNYEWPELEMSGAIVLNTRRGESEEPGYKFEWYGTKSEEYDYMYTIDVYMAIFGVKCIGKWGIELHFPSYYGVTKTQKYRFYRSVKTDMSKLDYCKVRVRFRYYTNHGYYDGYSNWHYSKNETVSFYGIYTVINNGKESSFQYIDNINKKADHANVYYDKTMDRELTSEEVEDLKEDAYSYDFVNDNQNRNWDDFSFQDPRTGVKTSAPVRISNDDGVVVVDIYE